MKLGTTEIIHGKNKHIVCRTT